MFKIDGVAYLDLQLEGIDFSYVLNYEPVIISSDIKSCIFGIHSENQFNEVKRLHSENIIFFKTRNGEEIKMKSLKENSISSAEIKVLKTTIVENNTVSFISGKVQGISSKEFKSKAFHFEGVQENLYDFVIHDISSKRIEIPIVNYSSSEQKFKRGDILGLLHFIDSSQNDDIKYVNNTSNIHKPRLQANIVTTNTELG